MPEQTTPTAPIAAKDPDTKTPKEIKNHHAALAKHDEVHEANLKREKAIAEGTKSIKHVNAELKKETK